MFTSLQQGLDFVTDVPSMSRPLTSLCIHVPYRSPLIGPRLSSMYSFSSRAWSCVTQYINTSLGLAYPAASGSDMLNINIESPCRFFPRRPRHYPDLGPTSTQLTERRRRQYQFGYANDGATASVLPVQGFDSCRCTY